MFDKLPDLLAQSIGALIGVIFSCGFAIWYVDNHAPYRKAESGITTAIEQLADVTERQTQAIDLLETTLVSQSVELKFVSRQLERVLDEDKKGRP